MSTTECALSHPKMTPSSLLSESAWSYSHRSEILQLYRLFFQYTNIDADALLDGTTYPAWWWLCPNTECIKVIKENMLTNWTDLPWQARFDLAMEQARWYHTEREQDSKGLKFFEILGRSVLDRAVALSEDHLGNSAMHLTAQLICLSNPKQVFWRNLTVELVQAGTNLHHANHSMMTPLMVVLEQCLWEIHVGGGSSCAMLQLWARLLHSAGVELAAYGSTETVLWAQLLANYGLETGDGDLRQILWSFGECPEDWRVWKKAKSMKIWTAEMNKTRLPGQWPYREEPWPSSIWWPPEEEDNLPAPFRWVQKRCANLPISEQADHLWSEWALDHTWSRASMLNDVQDDSGPLSMLLTKYSHKGNRPRSSSMKVLRHLGIGPFKLCYFPKQSWLPQFHMCLTTGTFRMGEFSKLRECAKEDHSTNTDYFWNSVNGINAQMRRFRLRYKTRAELDALPYSAYQERLPYTG